MKTNEKALIIGCGSIALIAAVIYQPLATVALLGLFLAYLTAREKRDQATGQDYLDAKVKSTQALTQQRDDRRDTEKLRQEQIELKNEAQRLKNKAARRKLNG